MILALSADQQLIAFPKVPIGVSMIPINLVPSFEQIYALAAVLGRKFCAVPSVCFPLSFYATTELVCFELFYHMLRHHFLCLGLLLFS